MPAPHMVFTTALTANAIRLVNTATLRSRCDMQGLTIERKASLWIGQMAMKCLKVAGYARIGIVGDQQHIKHRINMWLNKWHFGKTLHGTPHNSLVSFGSLAFLVSFGSLVFLVLLALMILVFSVLSGASTAERQW
jgi:hypothetical protein